MMSVVDALCAPYLALDAGFDGVSVSTIGSATGGETLAATDDVAARLDEIQLDLGEGPAWDAVRRHRAVLVHDVDAGTDLRWPLFSRASTALAARSIIAIPLTFADVTIGVVETYRRSPHDTADEIVSAMMAQARSTFFDVLAVTTHDSAADRSSNPRSRRIVHQATGMIIGRFGVTSADASTLLRAHAFTQGKTVVDVADDIVERRSDFLTRSSPTEEQT